MSLHLVLPGQVIATSSSENENDGFLRGHGTFVERDENANTDRLVASVAGRVERVNKLISVFPLASSVYHGQVGDLVVGRVTQVQATRWKVQLTTVGREAQLPLSGVHLPGGIQRVRTTQDQRDMRQFFQEGDLVSAEVHNVQNDGTLALHTRSLRYGKLENGCLIVVPPALMERRKHHFVQILGMTVLWGTNGYLWIQRSLPEERDTTSGEALAEIQEKLKAQHAATPVLPEERKVIARVRNSMQCLSMVHAMVTPESVERVYEASVDKNIRVADMLRPDVALQLTSQSRNA
jgi:exosome complex component RRP4